MSPSARSATTLNPQLPGFPPLGSFGEGAIYRVQGLGIRLNGVSWLPVGEGLRGDVVREWEKKGVREDEETICGLIRHSREE